MLNTLALATAAALALQGPVVPGPGLTPSQAELNTCLQAAGANDPDSRECFRLYNVREDDRLNRNWRAVMAIVGGPDTPTGAALRAEQRAWIAYKDIACRHFGMEGGTLDAILAVTCLGDVIGQRADDLETLRQHYTNR